MILLLFLNSWGLGLQIVAFVKHRCLANELPGLSRFASAVLDPDEGREENLPDAHSAPGGGAAVPG